MTAVNGGFDAKSAVLQAIDIVQLIGQTVALKRRGKDYVGLCPFHQEKTPSFHVSPTKQFFHCYGCKAGGNAIDFVIRRDSIEFIDALKLLAQQAGIELPKFGVSKEKTSERQLLLEAHSAACSLFEKLLSHPDQGKPARDYLAQRGFTAETIQRFQIGMAANAWDSLLKSPLLRKFKPDVLAAAGLVKPRQNGEGFYDTFRNRLMFPIRDEAGRIIAFGGRVLPGSDDPAKYLNSPETPLFSKGKCVFGIDLARHRIAETRTVAVVEGYTDVVMAHQYGVSNVVSVLGTALTAQHVQILRRFADRIVLLFDADTAGDLAVNRAIELFLTEPVEVAIASLPEGVDPDEYLLEHGAEGFNRLLTEAPSVLAFAIRRFKRQWTEAGDSVVKQDAARRQFIEPFAAARVQRSIDIQRWGAVLSALSKETGIPEAMLHREYQFKTRVARRPVAPSAETAAFEELAPPPGPARPLSARDRAERWILGVLLVEPHRWHQVQQHVQVEEFVDSDCRKLAEIYWSHQRDEGEPAFNQLLGHLTEPALTELAIRLVEEAEQLSDQETTLSAALDHLAQERRRMEEQKLSAAVRRTSERPLDEQSEVDVLKRLQEAVRQPDLRRGAT